MGKIRIALPAMQNYRGFCCAVENAVLPDLDGGRFWGTGMLLHVVFGIYGSQIDHGRIVASQAQARSPCFWSPFN
jgi:hypothetical protein